MKKYEHIVGYGYIKRAKNMVDAKEKGSIIVDDKEDQSQRVHNSWMNGL